MEAFEERQPLGLGRLISVLLVAMLLAGNGLFAAAVLLPRWQTYTEMNAQVAAARAAVEAAQLQPESDEKEVLEARIAAAEENLAEAAPLLLTTDEQDDILPRLYEYAAESAVRITDLQAQSASPAAPADDAAPQADTYTVRVFRLEVAGYTVNLMNFMVRVQEAAAPAVSTSNLSLTAAEDPDEALLVLDMALYGSPLASGEALADLPVFDTPLPLYVAGQEPLPMFPPDYMAGEAPSEPEPQDCPGAPAPLLHTGDRAIVDFNTSTTLNILTQPRTDGTESEVITRVSDGAQLQILDGPVCGEWRGHALWYWHIEYGGITGWVGEATVESRWLCPEDTPECA